MNKKETGMTDMDIDKEMILGGILCATTYIMLIICIIEIIQTGGIQCL